MSDLEPEESNGVVSLTRLVNSPLGGDRVVSGGNRNRSQGIV